MDKSEERTEILNKLYSRQIGTYGQETMNNLMSLKVLILGMRGNGLETAKNIVLSGVNLVTIYDPTLVSIYDLGSNYYLEEKDINKRRDESVLQKLKELNTFTHIDILKYQQSKEKEEYLEDFLSSLNFKYNVIVQTEIISEEKIIKLSDYCHQNEIKFIYGVTFGLNGTIFNDFGEDFTIYDNDGREPKKYHIKEISNAEKAIMTIEEERVGFNENDLIKLKTIEGMTELNKLKERIKILEVKKDENNKKKFVLDINTTNFSKYITGGLAYKPKESINKKFKSYKESFTIPFERKEKEEYFSIFEESEEFLYNEKFYLCIFLAIGKYLNKNKNLPELNNTQEAKEITKIANDLFLKIKNHDKEMNIKYDDDYSEEEIRKFDEKEVINIIKICRAEIAPMCSFIGGLISQEIIKTTGKYEPIEQWKFYDFSFIKSIEGEKGVKEEELFISNLKSRYDEQIAIFGNKFQNKIKILELFIIGSGAIGCELLKNFAMMGVSSKKEKNSIITDCDNIEMSNLNRQFLFRKEDIGKSKSLTACNAIKKMNPDFNCISLEEKVEPKTENIFDEKFWKSKDFVICGLDNVNARNYVNKKCHKFNKTFLDAGTNGTKGRVTVVIPYVTTPLEFSQTNNQTPIPMCTLKFFPTKIEDCIEWSKEKFNNLFKLNILQFKNFIFDSNEELFKKLNEKPQIDFIDIYKNIESFMKLMNQENEEKILEKIIYKALECFHEYYNIKIKELLKFNPPDKKTDDGKPFWNAIKKAPKIIEKMDINDKMTKLFIISFTHILSNCLLGKRNIDVKDDKINKIISEFNNNKNNEEKEEEKLDFDLENDEKFNIYKKEKLEEIKKYKEIINKNLTLYEKVKEEEFEKDGLDNYHIEFIQSSSNLRAQNYSIEPADYNKTLMVAGNIIQALPTTTAIVAGYLSLQLMALINSQNIEKEVQNANLDLSCNMFFNFSPTKYEPKAKPDNIKIYTSMTSQELLDFCKNEHNFDVYNFYVDEINYYTRRRFNEIQMKTDRYTKYMEKLNTKIEEYINSKLSEDKKKKEFIIQIHADRINTNGSESISSEDTEDELPLIEYKPYENKNN